MDEYCSYVPVTVAVHLSSGGTECAVGQCCACGMHAEYASMSTLNVWSTESVTRPLNESLTDVAQQSSGL